MDDAGNMGKIIVIVICVVFVLPMLMIGAIFGKVGGIGGISTQGNLPPAQYIPLYVVAGNKYHVPWWWLATINRIETDYNQDLSISPTGAVGPMQWEPYSWLTYGTNVLHLSDETNYGDPNNFVDAVFASAKYFSAMGLNSNDPSTMTPTMLERWGGSYDAGAKNWDNSSQETTQYRQKAVLYSADIQTNVVIPPQDVKYWENLPLSDIQKIVDGQMPLVPAGMPSIREGGLNNSSTR